VSPPSSCFRRPVKSAGGRGFTFLSFACGGLAKPAIITVRDRPARRVRACVCTHIYLHTVTHAKHDNHAAAAAAAAPVPAYSRPRSQAAASHAPTLGRRRVTLWRRDERRTCAPSTQRLCERRGGKHGRGRHIAARPNCTFELRVRNIRLSKNVPGHAQQRRQNRPREDACCARARRLAPACPTRQ
jgi:hypothetical protein